MSRPVKLSPFAGPEGLCVVASEVDADGDPVAPQVWTANEWAKVDGRDRFPTRRAGRLAIRSVKSCRLVGSWRTVGRAGDFAPAVFRYHDDDAAGDFYDIVSRASYGGLASMGVAPPLPAPVVVTPAPAAVTIHVPAL